MRDFFIIWFERLVGVIIILAALGIVIAAVATMAGATGQSGGLLGGFLVGLLMLVFGAIYIVLLGGALYLGLGIYQNTKRAAEALEKRGL